MNGVAKELGYKREWAKGWRTRFSQQTKHDGTALTMHLGGSLGALSVGEHACLLLQPVYFRPCCYSIS